MNYDDEKFWNKWAVDNYDATVFPKLDLETTSYYEKRKDNADILEYSMEDMAQVKTQLSKCLCDDDEALKRLVVDTMKGNPAIKMERLRCVYGRSNGNEQKLIGDGKVSDKKVPEFIYVF